jgi:hypothetical protein
MPKFKTDYKYLGSYSTYKMCSNRTYYNKKRNWRSKPSIIKNLWVFLVLENRLIMQKYDTNIY